MISDEELQEMIETEGRDYAEPEQMIETMATELLQLREEKRQAEEARAKSWEGAPEWANCRARDQGRGWIYLDLKPYSGTDEEWADIQHSRDVSMAPSSIIQWIATLETRP